MNDQDLLEALKVDLGISTDAYNGRLPQYIEGAKTEITREGVTLDLNQPGDCQLVLMYAGWLWRKRATGEGLPRMIRWALNNRLFQEKTGGSY